MGTTIKTATCSLRIELAILIIIYESKCSWSLCVPWRALREIVKKKAKVFFNTLAAVAGNITCLLYRRQAICKQFIILNMHLIFLCKQFVHGLFIHFIRNATVNRANSSALRLFMKTLAFRAFIWCNVIDIVANGRIALISINLRSIH